MKFLTKFAQIVLKVTEVAAGIAPIVSAAVPGESGKIDVVSQDLAQIGTIIQQVEVMGQVLGQPGPQKLQAAAPLVAQVLLQSSILVHHQIANPTLFQQGCTKLADGMADVLNSLKDDIETQDKA